VGAGGRGGGFERGGAGEGEVCRGARGGAGEERQKAGGAPRVMCFPRGPPELLRSRKMLRGPCVLHVYAFSRVLGYKKMFALFQEGRYFSLFFKKKKHFSLLYT